MNLSLTALLLLTPEYFLYTTEARRGVRVVEGARLESVCAGNRTEGSNPFLSANKKDWPLGRSFLLTNEAFKPEAFGWSVNAHIWKIVFFLSANVSSQSQKFVTTVFSRAALYEWFIA